MGEEGIGILPKACATFLTFFICSMDAPCFSRIPIALVKVSMMLDKSFSSATNTASSFSRISVAAFKSASSVLSADVSSSFPIPTGGCRQKVNLN